MPEFVVVARVGEILPDAAKTVAVGDRELAVFNVAGAYYAIDNICPHQGAPLAEGFVQDGAVTCPWHAWCFDLATGKPAPGGIGFSDVDAFEVRVESGEIAVATTPRA